MNTTPTSELTNAQLALRVNFSPDVQVRDGAYLEILRRLTQWGFDIRRNTPRHVIIGLFKRQSIPRDSDANGVYIPPDRVENDNVDYNYDVDWFQGEDEEDDLFKI